MGTVQYEMYTRINLGDLISQIVKRVDPDQTQNYLVYLSRFLSKKLSKHEFTKLCVSTLGPENIPLHNQLIRGIYNNAYRANCPPPSKPQHSLSPAPKKSRSCLRKRKDRSRPLGPSEKLGRTTGSQALHTIYELDVREDVNLDTFELNTPIQNHEYALVERPSKKSRLVETTVDVDSIKGPLLAPLGIPLCPPSSRLFSNPIIQSSNLSSSYDSDDLCKSEDLRRKMESIAGGHGLDGVSMDCANLLNNGLDVYLKRLIKSCTELPGLRSGTGHIQVKQGKPLNGVWQENHAESLNTNHSISLQDFRAAMELNPQNLGKYRPLLLEKILL